MELTGRSDRVGRINEASVPEVVPYLEQHKVFGGSASQKRLVWARANSPLLDWTQYSVSHEIYKLCCILPTTRLSF